MRLAQGCKATTETRIALVAFERGLSDRRLEQFYFVNRKGAKKRHFDTEAFAKKYDVDIRWIWDGELVFAVVQVFEMLTALKANYYAAWHGEKQQDAAP